MSDQSSTTTDQTGITRGPDGTIQEPGSNQNTNQEQTTKQPDQTTADTKTNDKTSAEPSLLNAKDDDKPSGAPEKYADFSLPEGLKADPEKMAAASALFKELGLPQEGAQKLVDLYAKELTEAAEAPVNAYLEQRKEWQKEIMAHPVLGKDLKNVRSTIGRAIDSLGATLAPKFREAMDLTGAGDHPAFVEAFFTFAQKLTEGRHVTGNGPSPHGQRAPGQPASTGAAALYPNLPSAGR